MKILIVDDSRTVRAVLVSVLTKAGYNNIEQSDSASEVFTTLQKPDSIYKDIDLVLIDIHMPGMNGIEFTRKIKQMENYKDVPIIVLTSSRMVSFMEDAFEAGANDFITKPFHSIELIARVKSSLKLKQEMDKRKERETELMDRERELIEVNRFLEIANQSYLKSSALDGLTGITNRKYFNQSVEMEWNKAVRNSSALAVIMLDVDHFKAFNDNYGHQKGDDCLISVANTIKRTLTRPEDMVARYGGEEFVVLLPNINMGDVADIAEKIRKNVENLNIRHEFSSAAGYVTISGGVSIATPDKVRSYEEIIRLADTNLYRAKDEGRNRIVIPL